MNKKSNNQLELTQIWKFSISEKTYKSELIPNENIKPGNWFNADVPGTIHTDLFDNGLIDDPYYSDNELKLGWIAEQDWIYKAEFKYIEDSNDDLYLVFDGLDTIADIFINKSKLGSTNNMFLSYKFNLAGKLKQGDNVIRVIFYSPLKYARAQEKKYGKLPVALNSERVYIRKAQYSFGWDWGPSFPTSGIWKNVYLEKIQTGKIENFIFNTANLTNKNAKVEIISFVQIKNKNTCCLNFHLYNDKHSFEKQVKVNVSGFAKVTFNINEPDMWWPNGCGDPALYSLELKLIDNHRNVLDTIIKKVGIRTIELIEKEGNDTTFKIKINNKNVFCNGIDWIPSDSFIPRISEEKYSALLHLTKDGNMNMVRVWGGGFYENDKFYELCDQLGLLIWQDFMFACGAYPEHESFIKNVKNEIEENVSRLQYHPSIAIWCGNNENEWVWYQNQKTSYTKMPGYKIYHSVMPGILKMLDPFRPYWPSSPFGNEKDPDSFESGNTHQWDIWSRWIDYTKVVNDKSLFVTEFGFQGPANKDTLEKVIPPVNRNINDRIFEFHNKQIEGPERIVKFLSNHLPLETKWDDFLYLTQLNQGFALKICLEHWATNNRTNGSLIWQLNDSWPVTSWALIDYDLKPKLAYHFVKNIFSQQLIHFNKNGKISCEIFNKSDKDFEGYIKTFVYDLNKDRAYQEFTDQVKVKGNKSKSFRTFDPKDKNSDQLLFIGSIYNSENLLLHRNYFLDNKWKYINLPQKDLTVSFVNDPEQKLRLQSNSLNLFVDLYSKGKIFRNRGFILLPGEQIDVQIDEADQKIKSIDDIKCTALNDYLSKSRI